MPNPYAGIQSGISDLTRNLLMLRGQNMNQAISEAELGMRGATLQESQRQHNIGAWGTPEAQPGMPTLQARGVQAEEQKLKSLYPGDQPWDMSNYTRIASRMKLQGIPIEKLTVMNDLRAMAEDKSLMRGDVAGALEAKWPQWQKSTTDDLNNEIMSLSDKASKMQESDPKRKELMGQIEKLNALQGEISNIKPENVKQMFFPDVHQWELNQKSELLAQRQTFQNELLSQKFEQWKEVQGIKLANAKELMDAKYAFLKDIKMTSLSSDLLGRKILANAYQQSLRDVDIELRNFKPFMYDTPEAAQQAKSDLEAKRADIVSDIKELSGVKSPGKAAPGGTLDEATALSILKEAGGDKNKARQIAKKRGYKF